MSLPVFMELVELRTKLASILPFGLGVLFALCYFDTWSPVNTAIYFVALFAFDMMTTALNNLMDYHQAHDDAYRRQTNVIGRTGLAPRVVVGLVLGLLVLATGLGVWLVIRTSWPLLGVGALCFGIGIFYTFGPLPLSRLPLGEVFAGVTMGLLIPGIATYINVPASKFIAVQLHWPHLAVTGALPALLALGLVCLMPIATIANVMLANNLADLAEDTANHRTTLPMYLGQRWSLVLYQWLAYVGYAGVLVAVAVGLMPWPVLLCLLSLPVVRQATRRFVAKQSKRETFHTAITTLVAENVSLLVGLLVGWGVTAW